MLGTLLAGMADPSVGKRVADHGREGKVMEPTNCSAKVLHGNILRSEYQKHPVPVVDGEWRGSDGGGDNLLDGEASEVGAVGVVEVRVFAGDDDGAGDIGTGLISVKRDGLPPLRDRRGRSGAAGIGG